MPAREPVEFPLSVPIPLQYVLRNGGLECDSVTGRNWPLAIAGATTSEQTGIYRTATGRDTYYPDGLASNKELSAAVHTPDRNVTGVSQEASDASQEDMTSSDAPDKTLEMNEPQAAAGQRNHGDHRRDLKDDDRSSKDVESRVDHDVEKQDLATAEKGQTEERQTESNIVEWNGTDDPENPQNMPRWRKWLITAAFGLMTLVVTFASSIFSTATEVTAKEFGVSTVVMTLGVSLFVAGFAVGPLIWGPLSELYGRKIPLFVGYSIFAIFQIPVAVGQNLQTIMLCRFFGGLFASAPLAVVGGALADFWDPVDRGIATAIFSGATFLGPVTGPICGSFIVESYLGWRWTAWLTMIMAAAFGTIGFFIIPETYAPVLLKRRAARLRYETKNWALHAQMEEQPVDLKLIVEKYLLRPFKMIVLEPILLLITLYMSLIYGILYLFFEAYPIAFQQQRMWRPGVGSLPFAAIIVGVIAGVFLIAWESKTLFARSLQKEGKAVPEKRLPTMMIGGFVFPASLFWFAWTSNPRILWVPQVLAGAPIGMGVLLIFLQGLNYIVDCYQVNANSAIAANTFLRSLVGAGFPMFAAAMYHNLGVAWATSLLGFLTAALFPVPILFYIYGKKIRKLSRYSPDA